MVYVVIALVLLVFCATCLTSFACLVGLFGWLVVAVRYVGFVCLGIVRVFVCGVWFVFSCCYGFGFVLLWLCTVLIVDL